MLHFSMLLCMAQAEEAVMPPPQYAPYAIAATAAALVIYMIRAKRRRVEWRFRRDDIVVVAVDGEGGAQALARVDEPCQIGYNINGKMRYRVTYLEGTHGPPRVLQEDLTHADRQDGYCELADGAGTTNVAEAEAVTVLCLSSITSRGTTEGYEAAEKTPVEASTAADCSTPGVEELVTREDLWLTAPCDGTADAKCKTVFAVEKEGGRASAGESNQAQIEQLIADLGGSELWHGRTSSFMVCSGALRLHLSLTQEAAQQLAADVGPHRIKALIDEAVYHKRRAKSQKGKHNTRPSTEQVDGFTVVACSEPLPKHVTEDKLGSNLPSVGADCKLSSGVLRSIANGTYREGDEMYDFSSDDAEVVTREEAQQQAVYIQELAAHSAAAGDGAVTREEVVSTHTYHDMNAWRTCTVHARYNRGIVVKDTLKGLIKLVKADKVRRITADHADGDDGGKPGKRCDATHFEDGGVEGKIPGGTAGKPDGGDTLTLRNTAHLVPQICSL